MACHLRLIRFSFRCDLSMSLCSISAHFTNFVIIPDSVMGHNVPLSPPLSRAVYESSKSYL